jgi:hypothetical protein
LQILDFEGARETAYRPWAAGTIPRRFCSAVALVSGGRKHQVNYWIAPPRRAYFGNSGKGPLLARKLTQEI